MLPNHILIHSNRIYLEDGCVSGYLEIEDRIIKIK